MQRSIADRISRSLSRRIRTPLCKMVNNMTFMQFARTQMFKPNVAPFTYSMMFTFCLLGSLSLGGTKEARAASKYLNPPKH